MRDQAVDPPAQKRRVLVDSTPESQARVNSDQSVLLKGDVRAFLLGSQASTGAGGGVPGDKSSSLSGTSTSHVSDSQPQPQPLSYVSNRSLDFRLESADSGSLERFGGGATQAVRSAYGSRSSGGGGSADDPVLQPGPAETLEERESQKENSQPVSRASPTRSSRAPSLATSPDISRQLLGGGGGSDTPFRSPNKGKGRLSAIDDYPTSSPLRGVTSASASQLHFSVGGRTVDDDLVIPSSSAVQNPLDTLVSPNAVATASPLKANKQGFKYRSFNDIKVLPWSPRKRKKDEWGSDGEEDEEDEEPGSSQDRQRSRKPRQPSASLDAMVAEPSSNSLSYLPDPQQQQQQLLVVPSSSAADELEETQLASDGMTEKESGIGSQQPKEVQPPLFLSSTADELDDRPGTFFFWLFFLLAIS
jgi:hypothetical protein